MWLKAADTFWGSYTCGWHDIHDSATWESLHTLNYNFWKYFWLQQEKPAGKIKHLCFPWKGPFRERVAAPFKMRLLLLLSHVTYVDSVPPHDLQPARLLCPWDSLGKSTRVGCHALLQGVFPTQRSNLHLLHCRQILYHWATRKAHLYKLQRRTMCLQNYGLKFFESCRTL